jgi:hypothetical protein
MIIMAETTLAQNILRSRMFNTPVVVGSARWASCSQTITIIVASQIPAEKSCTKPLTMMALFFISIVAACPPWAGYNHLLIWYNSY